MQANFEKGKVPMGRWGGRSVPGQQTVFVSLGPFPGFGHCVGVGFSTSSMQNTLTQVGAVITYVSEESAGAFNAGGSLLLPTGVVVERQPAISLETSFGGLVVQPMVPLYVPVQSGAAWVLMGVRNLSQGNVRFSGWALFGHVLEREGDGGARTQ